MLHVTKGRAAFITSERFGCLNKVVFLLHVGLQSPRFLVDCSTFRAGKRFCCIFTKWESIKLVLELIFWTSFKLDVIYKQNYQQNRFMLDLTFQSQKTWLIIHLTFQKLPPQRWFRIGDTSKFSLLLKVMKIKDDGEEEPKTTLIHRLYWGEFVDPLKGLLTGFSVYPIKSSCIPRIIIIKCRFFYLISTYLGLHILWHHGSMWFLKWKLSTCFGISANSLI